MTTPDMSHILQDLAAGRIDAAEAARRIDAVSARHTEGSGSERAEGSRAAGTAEENSPSAPAEPEGATTEDRGATSAEARAQDQTSDADSADRAATADPEADSDAWASATDRPQHPTYRRDSFRSEPPAARPASARVRSDQARGQQARGNQNGVTKISVRAVGRRVRIVGETTISTLSADGPHVLRRNGAVLEVSSDGETGFSLDGFSILRAPRSFEDIRSLGLGKELFLRVNPAIEVDVEVTAGSLVTERVPHLGKVRVTAGSGKLLDVAEIKDALIQAGSATVKALLTSGRSRIRAESGTLNIQLADQSDVTVRTEAQLGNVSWSGGHTGSGHEVVMGNGSARLDVEVVMGHAQVRVGSDVAADAS